MQNIFYLLNIEQILIVYSAILAGQFASTSVTSKAIIKPLTLENTNWLLSLYITISFYSVFGVLILGFIVRGLIEGCIILILSFITYKILNKYISKINFPTLIDCLLYCWTLFLFCILAYVCFQRYF